MSTCNEFVSLVSDASLSIGNRCDAVIIASIFQLVHFSSEEKIYWKTKELTEMQRSIESFLSSLANWSLPDEAEEWVGEVEVITSKCHDALNYDLVVDKAGAYLTKYYKYNQIVFDKRMFNKFAQLLKTPEDSKDKVKFISFSIASSLNSSEYAEKLYHFLWQLFISIFIFQSFRKVKLLITLNPFSWMDFGFLIAANHANIKKWFYPHGLPQKSMLLHDFDYITPLTTFDEVWFEYGAKFINMRWAECVSGVPVRKKIGKNSFNILFISQLSGSELHKVRSLWSLSVEAIQALLLRPDVHRVRLRVRDIEELKYFSNTDEKLDVSLMNGGTINEDIVRSDILLSSSSTGLLYSQCFNKPVIQLVDDEIIDIWPYQLTSEQRVVRKQDNLVLAFERVMSDIKVKPYQTRFLYSEHEKKVDFLENL